MDQLGRGRRGAGGEVVLLDQQHAQAASGGVARDARAVDAAADDREVEIAHAPNCSRASMARHARLASSSLASGRCRFGDDGGIAHPDGGDSARWTIATAMSSSPEAPARSARRGRRADRGRRHLPRAVYRAEGSRALSLARPRLGKARFRFRSCRRVRGRKPLRWRAEAVGVDPSRRRLCHGAGCRRPARPT